MAFWNCLPDFYDFVRFSWDQVFQNSDFSQQTFIYIFNQSRPRLFWLIYSIVFYNSRVFTIDYATKQYRRWDPKKGNEGTCNCVIQNL